MPPGQEISLCGYIIKNMNFTLVSVVCIFLWYCYNIDVSLYVIIKCRKNLSVLGRFNGIANSFTGNGIRRGFAKYLPKGVLLRKYSDVTDNKEIGLLFNCI